jgi:carbonic anhydrase
MSNAQQGTRGLSSSDWTRLKRIKGAKPVYLDNFTQPTSQFTPPNNASATIFVIACIDPRYTAALETYLVATLGLTTTYDLFVLAGASLGGSLTANGSGPGQCAIVSTNNNWRTALQDHIQVAIALHNVQQILIVDHLDCGAYTACGQSDSIASHKAKFEQLSALIRNTNYIPNGGTVPFLGSQIFSRGIFGFYFTMPTTINYSETILYNYNDPPIEKFRTYFPDIYEADILILGCIDPRFTAILSSFLTNYKEVRFNYDLFILAGSSIGANQSYDTNAFPTVRNNDPSTTDYPDNLLANNGAGIGNLGRNWGPTFFDHIPIAIALHNITEVWVFDHLDCGAYKAIKLGGLNVSDADPSIHVTEIKKLQGYIHQTHPSLKFKGFIMDIDGSITKVVDSGGIKFEKPLGSFINRTQYSIPSLIPKTFGASRIRCTSSEYTDLKAYHTADYVTQNKVVINGANLTSTALTVTKLCTCSAPPYSAKKQGLCIKCSHDNRWQFKKPTN